MISSDLSNSPHSFLVENDSNISSNQDQDADANSLDQLGKCYSDSKDVPEVFSFLGAYGSPSPSPEKVKRSPASSQTPATTLQNRVSKRARSPIVDRDADRENTPFADCEDVLQGSPLATRGSPFAPRIAQGSPDSKVRRLMLGTPFRRLNENFPSQSSESSHSAFPCSSSFLQASFANAMDRSINDSLNEDIKKRIEERRKKDEESTRNLLLELESGISEVKDSFRPKVAKPPKDNSLEFRGEPLSLQKIPNEEGSFHSIYFVKRFGRDFIFEDSKIIARYVHADLNLKKLSNEQITDDKGLVHTFSPREAVLYHGFRNYKALRKAQKVFGKFKVAKVINKPLKDGFFLSKFIPNKYRIDLIISRYLDNPILKKQVEQVAGVIKLMWDQKRLIVQDFKNDNVLFDEKNELVVIDYGESAANSSISALKIAASLRESIESFSCGSSTLKDAFYHLTEVPKEAPSTKMAGAAFRTRS